MNYWVISRSTLFYEEKRQMANRSDCEDEEENCNAILEKQEFSAAREPAFAYRMHHFEDIY
jgi:hypothetical protein